MVDIEKIIAEKGPMIDECIRSAFPNKGIQNLHDAIWYHMGTGGKRLRPVLAIATCEALGGDVKKIVHFAAACEILHNWFLVHDDIEDGDRVRRNKDTVWVKYGIAHGVNVGDYMAQKVYELILKSEVDEKTKLRLLTAMIDTSLRTAEGQTMDIDLRDNDAPTEKDYMDMVTGKTAYYLTVPAVGGAIVAGASESVIKKIMEYGLLIGPAFQIRDDVIDLTEGKGRNEIGRDIKEGKKSLPVIHCLKKCSGDERKKMLAILKKPPEQTTDSDVSYVIQLFRKYGSIEYADAKAKELYEKSLKHISGLPPALRDVLATFGSYLITRKR